MTSKSSTSLYSSTPASPSAPWPPPPGTPRRAVHDEHGGWVHGGDLFDIRGQGEVQRSPSEGSGRAADSDCPSWETDRRDPAVAGRGRQPGGVNEAPRGRGDPEPRGQTWDEASAPREEAGCPRAIPGVTRVRLASVGT